MDNTSAARLKETEDQIHTAVDLWPRSKQLSALQYLRIVTNMEGRMSDLGYEISKALKVEAQGG